MTEADAIEAMIGSRIGVFDLACPECGPGRQTPANRNRRVLRVWSEPPVLTWHCARCEWDGGKRSRERVDIPDDQPKPTNPTSNETSRIDRARTIWREGRDSIGSPVETYLRSRGCGLPPDTDEIRFHAGCLLGGKRYPAMLALMRDALSNEPRAVHRTALRPDGLGKAVMADGGAAKRMIGPAKGCVIKLTPDADVTLGLGIAEGIEDGLTILGAGWSPIWAAGSAGVIERLPVLPSVEALTIFADADEAGMKAARACARRWSEAGADAEIQAPPQDDWNTISRAA